MGLMDRLADLTRHPNTLNVRDFNTSSNQTGEASEIAAITADTPIALKGGRKNPLKWAIPAYQSFTTGGDGSEQTFDLSHSLLDPPDTQAVVVWFGGDYQGVPTFDTEANTITVDGPGSAETVHAFYITDEYATVTLRKEHPSAKTGGYERVYETNLALVQPRNQNEQPEYLSVSESPLQRFVAADMELIVRIDAPYTVRFEDPDGDGATATNAIVQVPALKGADTVAGLSSEIKADMGGR